MYGFWNRSSEIEGVLKGCKTTTATKQKLRVKICRFRKYVELQ